MRNIILSILIVLTAFAPEQAKAQIDPALTVMVLEFTETAKKQYESQLETMALETEGHIWLREEVKATAEYQRQFDNYLNSFRNVIAYAAQAYGFYHEIDRLCKNMEKLGRQIGETPENAVALALHGKRNDIYVNIINKGVGIVNCIRQACIDKKMTEKERIELVFSIRPQLQDMNRQLAMLTKLVRHTTLAQVWRSIEGSPPKEGKGAIAEGCLGMWRTNARGVRP